MLTINKPSFEEKASALLGVFEKLGLKLDIRSFKKRLHTQKIVYMLQLHPEFEPYLNYHYSLFIHGPYSPELASIYYRTSRHLKPMDVEVSKKALEYGREIARWNNDRLEIASTLIEAIKVNRGITEDKELVERVHELKPRFEPPKILEVLETVKALKENYDLNF